MQYLVDAESMMMRPLSHGSRGRVVRRASRVAAGIAMVLAVALTGCKSGGGTGALVGGGLGALIGQAAGGDTGATLVGAAVGSGVGYVVGNEADKAAAAERQREHEQRSHEQYYDRGQSSHDHGQVAPLAGTRWQITSIVPEYTAEAYVSKIVEFRPDSRLITTTTREGGAVDVTDEHYRVVGNTLIINRTVNARFEVQGRQLVIDTATSSTLLERLPG